MDWQTVFNISIVTIVVAFVLFRMERKWWWLGALVLALPTVVLVIVWLGFNAADWLAAFIGLLIGGGLMGAWWFIWGRKLPPTTSDIKVWGQDAAPKPKPAELQAELQLLREQKEQLEAELKKLREENK